MTQSAGTGALFTPGAIVVDVKARWRCLIPPLSTRLDKKQTLKTLMPQTQTNIS